MRHLYWIAIVAAALLTGCGKDEGEHKGHDHDGGMHEEKMEELDFSGLSAADAKLAKAQAVCPVSGEELGSMGSPVKVDVKGQTVFLCCKSCLKDLNADPDKYLAKLKK